MDDPRPIGLTGAIAGGKSTLLAMLAEMGLRTASSDAVAREIFAEEAVQSALAARLGVPTPVDRATLREAMLRDPSLRRWTNRLMHPLVGARLATVEADVVEVPLLFEACLQGRYREVWTASCGPEERARRLRARYGPEADLGAFGAWQLSERAKDALADRVFRTDRPIGHVLSLLRAEAGTVLSGSHCGTRITVLYSDRFAGEEFRRWDFRPGEPRGKPGKPIRTKASDPSATVTRRGRKWAAAPDAERGPPRPWRL